MDPVQWLSCQCSSADAKTAQTSLHCVQVEGVATQNLQSSSRYGRPLRNYNFCNDNESFPLYVDFFFPPTPTRLLTDLIIYYWVTRLASYKRPTLRSLPVIFCGIAHLISCQCCVVVFCVLCPMLAVSIEFPQVLSRNGRNDVFLRS